MITKLGITFYVMDFYNQIQLGDDMVNYYIYQECLYPKNMLNPPWMM